MRGHCLRVFQGAAGFEIRRDARGAECMAADPYFRSEIGGAALDHAPGVDAVHRVLGQRAGASHGGAEQGSLAGVADFGRLDVRVEIGFESVMRRHLVALAAFFVQAHPPALALRKIILDAHRNDSTDAGKRKRHHRDQCAVAETDETRHVDAVQKLARLFAGQHRGLAGLDDVLRSAHRMRRIGGDHLAGDEPVEQHADRGEVLLDGRFLEVLAEAADVSRDVHRFDVDELLDILAPIAPGEEAPAGMQVRVARVLVVDRDGEELQKPAHRVFAGRGDDRRHDRSGRVSGFDRRQRPGFDCHKLG